MIKRGLILFFLLLLNFTLIFDQEIITAVKYMEMVSEKYGTIRDMEASIAIRSGGSDMTGTISHLSPSFLRIDFSRPAEQVIVFNGELFSVYLPEYRAVLNQNINQTRRTASAGPGLSMLRRNYVPSFVTGPNPEPLDPNSRENVVRLRLTRTSAAEGFRELILCIDPDSLLMRRIEGTTLTGSVVRFDFTNIRINQGIPEQRFIYDSPASANIYNNFLFRED